MEMIKVDPTYETMIENKALKERTLVLNDYVDMINIYKITYYMDKIKRYDDANGIEDKYIIIEISSGGGSCTDGQFLMSKMRKFSEEYGYKIITRINSYAYSMGFMIFIMGDEREMYRYSEAMYHDCSLYIQKSMKSDEIRDLDEYMKRSWEVFKKIILERTKISEEDLDNAKKCKLDVFLNAEECVELGVATKII